MYPIQNFPNYVSQLDVFAQTAGANGIDIGWDSSNNTLNGESVYVFLTTDPLAKKNALAAHGFSGIGSSGIRVGEGNAVTRAEER